MNYQTFICIVVLLIFTINSSLTIDLVGNDLQQVFDENNNDIEDKFEWRRLSKLPQPSPNIIMNRNKMRPRLLTYDFLLHQWILRKKDN
ncbi:unnamed protein product [Rotaria sordida]|uniref:Uncharacterized protein n=1 Tax=Rotaria sordida TaxID=392033 RepID=A0A814ZTZ7_9BILA|nr:unnamed protein product [Rotaria sordida]CAF1246793.1 unnamed protein product [Rotaria sordida]CAF1526819.1 unnamed protein product [Rotaria sordida]CAF1527389.1 unnamed protein product [Rotaria sordida]CAF3806974.1 unnamed protein product [Rotaria sordida]